MRDYPKYLDPATFGIARNDPSFNGPHNDTVVVLDEEGNRVTAFPAAWTDDQVRAAVAFANSAYAQGIRYGRNTKVAELKRALDFD